MPRLCLHAIVSGRVQGVGFRQHTDAHAQRLELDGWVRNLAQGQVEVLMEGEEVAVRELCDWLAQGPAAAEVMGLELNEQPLQGVVGFIVRR
jgi:acylphosphatase